MKMILSLTLMLFALTSCNEPIETKFEHDGVSLISPTDWKITDEENFDNEGYYLAIEKEGLNSSGLLTITWLNNEVELNDWRSLIIGELKKSTPFENSDLAFGSSYESKYNGIKSISTDFSVTILNLKHSGVIHVFNKANKTFGVVKQEADEDNSENKKGFELIEKSLIIE